jgi:ABC-2 type transport system permease protein
VDGEEVIVRALMVIYTIWLREFKAFLRERSRIVAMIGQPLLYLLIVGQGIASGLSLNGAPGGIGYLTFMYPGILGMSVLFTSIFSAISIIWDREFGFLKEVLVAPVPRWAVAAGKILGGSTVAMFQSAMLIALAPFVGVSLSVVLVLELLAICFLISIAITSLGVFIAARMRSMQGFQMLMNFLVMPLYFLSGAMFPIRSAPPWMNVLMKLDPLTYGVDALRNLVFSGVSTSSGGQLIDAARDGGLLYSSLAFDGPVMVLVALVLAAAACIRFSRAQQ